MHLNYNYSVPRGRLNEEVMYQIVQSGKSDITSIARCHNECFKNSLSSQLGLAYIKKTFEWFFDKDNRFLFHVVVNGKVAGYCGGFIPQYIGDGSTSGMMQYAMPQAITGALLHPWLLLHKDVRAMYPLIFKNIKRRLFKKQVAAKPVEPVKTFDKRVGLVVIGVLPQQRGTGIFQALMREFENKARSYNIHKLVLTVRKNNARAIRAYTKQGWFTVNEHLQTLELCKNLQ